MNIGIYICCCLLAIVLYYTDFINAYLTHEDISKLDKIRIKDEKTFNSIKNVHINWYSVAVKALLGAMGKDLYEHLPNYYKKQLIACLDVISDKRDIVSGARCLTIATPHRQTKQQIVDDQKKQWIGSIRIENDQQSNDNDISTDTNNIPTLKHLKIIDDYFTNIKNFNITDQNININPIIYGGRPKNYRSRFHQYYQRMKRRHRRSPYRLVANGVDNKEADGEGADNDSGNSAKYNREVVLKHSAMPSLKSHFGQSPLQQVTHALTGFFRKGNDEMNPKFKSTWAASYHRLSDMTKAIDKYNNGKSQRAKNLRLLDLVLGYDQPTTSASKSTDLFNDKQIDITSPDFFTDAFHMVKSLAGVGAESNFKFLSPRIAPLMPDKIKEPKSRLLSPSLMAFYSDDSPDNIAPLPKMLSATGMGIKDQEAMMEFVMEVSGARVGVDRAIEVLKSGDFLGLARDVIDSNDRLTKIFESLVESFSKRQKDALDTKGYAFLDRAQMEAFYGPNGHFNYTIDFNEMDFDDYEKWTDERKERALWTAINRIANNRSVNVMDDDDDVRMTNDSNRRRKREGLPFYVGDAVTLSPYIFAPPIGPSVLGPVILSPNIFSPETLNAGLFSPYVFSTAIGMAFIISPYLLSPYILSPFIWAPFIINPYMLSPNIFNPYLNSPLFLSPYLMCPDLASPMAGINYNLFHRKHGQFLAGGPVLSPYVLSPAVLTESALMVDVLSPSLLSK